MSNFTFEFLPHFAGAIKRNADFSLYEVKWNNYGEYGCFEFQVNIPSLVHIERTFKNTTEISNLLYDVSVKNANGKWHEKRLTLYERYKGKVLEKLPNDILMFPAEWLILRLILSFNKDERLAIADMFNFCFSEHIDPELILAFKSDDSIFKAMKKYYGHIKL